MNQRRATFILASLLSATCLTGLARTTMAHAADDVSKYVLTDTAYTEAPGYVINRADSMKVSGHSFVGPGPVTITFKAEMTQQPSYCAWELAADNRFENLLDQFRVMDAGGTLSQFDYEFEEAGTFYVRFVADFLAGENEGNNDEGKVSYSTAEPYQVQITESLLEIPNLITPDNPDSQNSVFRVRYKSLISYEIWIHNRWGQELFHSTDPTEDWDGHFGGKSVPTGAYYYLIKAEGTDGISYNKKGSLNVLKTRDASSYSR